MKIVPRTRLNVVNENGDLASGSKCENKSESGGGSKKKGLKITNETQTVNKSKRRCVLADRTNSNWTDNKKPTVSQSVIRSCGLKEIVTQKSSSYLKSLPSNSGKGLISKPLYLNESFKDRNMKNSKDNGAKKLHHEIGQRENTVDVYEFLLEDDDIDSENRCKTQKANKCKTQKPKRSRNKRKLNSLEDSPDEVMPAKKIRKPLRERTRENSMCKTNSKFETKAVESPLLGNPFSKIQTENRGPEKTVHFNIPSCKRLELTNNATSTPKSKCLRLTQNEKNITPKLSVVNQTSLPHTGNTKISGPSPYSAARQSKPVCAKEVSKQLLSFFSPIAKINSDSDTSVASRTKPTATHSLQAELESTKNDTATNFCEISEPSSSPQLPHHSDKQVSFTTSNYFGFEEDESEDEVSPVKLHNRSYYQTGKFQCSTPKPVNISEKSSLPFRFPAISSIKLQRPPQLAGKTFASSTKHHRKNGGNLNAFIRKEPHAVREKSVKQTYEPAIFDIEEDDEQCNSKDDLDREFIPSVTVKDSEVDSFPNKRVLPQRSYATPKPGVSRQPEDEETEENESQNETWETAKKHKRSHRPPKKNEADEWAKSFNSMCENIESFELIVE